MIERRINHLIDELARASFSTEALKELSVDMFAATSPTSADGKRLSPTVAGGEPAEAGGATRNEDSRRSYAEFLNASLEFLSPSKDWVDGPDTPTSAGPRRDGTPASVDADAAAEDAAALSSRSSAVLDKLRVFVEQETPSPSPTKAQGEGKGKGTAALDSPDHRPTGDGVEPQGAALPRGLVDFYKTAEGSDAPPAKPPQRTEPREGSRSSHGSTNEDGFADLAVYVHEDGSGSEVVHIMGVWGKGQAGEGESGEQEDEVHIYVPSQDEEICVPSSLLDFSEAAVDELCRRDALALELELEEEEEEEEAEEDAEAEAGGEAVGAGAGATAAAAGTAAAAAAAAAAGVGAEPADPYPPSPPAAAVPPPPPPPPSRAHSESRPRHELAHASTSPDTSLEFDESPAPSPVKPPPVVTQRGTLYQTHPARQEAHNPPSGSPRAPSYMPRSSLIVLALALTVAVFLHQLGLEESNHSHAAGPPQADPPPSRPPAYAQPNMAPPPVPSSPSSSPPPSPPPPPPPSVTSPSTLAALDPRTLLSSAPSAPRLGPLPLGCVHRQRTTPTRTLHSLAHTCRLTTAPIARPSGRSSGRASVWSFDRRSSASGVHAATSRRCRSTRSTVRVSPGGGCFDTRSHVRVSPPLLRARPSVLITCMRA